MESAHTWVIVGPDGLAREIELCDAHSGPVANTYALARPTDHRLIAARPVKRATKAEAPPAPAAPPTPPTPAKAEPEPIWR